MKTIINNQKGFTLVEVIVVAVIVLILAAVAIPLYNGYIDDSRRSIAQGAASTAAKKLMAAVQLDIIGNVENAKPLVDGAGQVMTIPAKAEGGEPSILSVPAGYRLAIEEPGCAVVRYLQSSNSARHVTGAVPFLQEAAGNNGCDQHL